MLSGKHRNIGGPDYFGCAAEGPLTLICAIAHSARRAAISGTWVRLGLLLLMLVSSLSAHALRQMESLGRGVVAVRSSTSQVFVSWRLLGLDPAGIGFNVYRSANGGAVVKVNPSVLTNGCNYTDTTATLTQTNAYHVRPVIGGVEQGASAAWTLPPNAEIGPLFRIKLSQPPTNHAVHNVWVGDLDGDGEYEFVLAWGGTVAGVTQKLQAYKRDGTFLWEVDFGPTSIDPDNIYVSAAAIIAGQWDGSTVYDLDGDGRAEVIVKSANGVTFGDGTTLNHGDDLTQFISVLDGMTGAERTRVLLPNPWKESTGRPLGTLFGIGYPDGERPSLMIHAKNRNPSLSFNLIESAWDFRGGVLSNRWSLQWNGDGGGGPVNSHQVRIVDVDGDGKDELVPGMHAISANGSLLWDLGDQDVVHGDRFHISDLDPSRPGQEMYGIQQNNPNGLIEYFADAATGQLLWVYSVGTNGWDAARGTASDIDPRYLGTEVWSFNGIHTATGMGIITNDPVRPWPNLQVWWDGDLLGENLDQTLVDKWNYATASTSRQLTGYHYGASDNSRNVPQLYGDILGDWREEIVYDASNHTQLVVFTTTSTTTNRLYTLAQNPAYRNCLTVKGYVQANLPDYYLGVGMSNPPTPNIAYVTSTPPAPAPNAPGSLTATAISSSQVHLTWSDDSSNEESFRVERSTNGINFTQVALVTANFTNYTDGALASSTTYTYRLRASNLGGSSAYTTNASATTFTPAYMVKSDTTTMNTAADWSGTTPVITEVGLFNNVLSAPNAAALTLGGNVALRGLIFNNNLSGAATVAAGNTLTLGDVGLDLSLANQNVTFNNAIVLASNQVWNVGGGRTLTLNGALTNSGHTATKTGTGTLVLGMSTSGTGANVQVDAGTAQISVSSGVMVSLNGGTCRVAGSFPANPIHVMGGGGTEQNDNANRTWNGNLSGSGPLTVVASAIHSWGGNNTNYTGTITLQGAGTFRLNSTNAVSAGTAYQFNGGTMSANASGIFKLGSLAGAGTLNSGAGQNYSIGALGEDTTFSGVIAGAGFVEKTGVKTLILSGANTYSGGTIVSGGTLQFGNNGTSGVPGTGNITNNATLVFDRSDTVSDGGFGVISGTGTLIQAGDGVLVLTNTHVHTGPTFVEGGALALAGNGSIASSASIYLGPGTLFDVSARTSGGMTLASGKTLRGSGSVKGNFTVGSGASLLPGESIGTLTFSNALTLAAGSTNVFEASAGPSTSDQVRVFGALTNGGTLRVTNISANAFVAGDNLQLLDAASYSGSFQAVLLPPLSGSLVWNTNLLASSGIVSVVALPPPTISGIQASGGDLVLSGSGGPALGMFYIQSTTNLPAVVWTPMATNQFDAGGNFSLTLTNAINPNQPRMFYRIQLP
jgi:rhamnogalacturonan endolyase